MHRAGAIICTILLSTSAAAPQPAPQRPRAFLFVSTFVNHGGNPDDAWIGVALKLTLLLKLSYVPDVPLVQYERHCPSPLSPNDVPEHGATLDVWATQIGRTYFRAIVGAFSRDDGDLHFEVWLASRSREPAKLADASGPLARMGDLLDEAIPSILRWLNAPTPLARPWQGKVMTPSVEALEWFSRGMLAYREGYDEAGLHFTSALDVDDNFIEAHWMMGRVARAQRSPLVALEHLLRVTNAVPDSGQAHYYLASTLLSLGRQEEAIEEYKTARELSSNLRRSADAAIIRSYQRISQPDEAIAWGRKALAEGDEDSYILQAIGRVYQETGDYARAIEYYERAMGAATKRGATGWVWRSRQYMAESYEAMGRLDDAVQQLKLGIQAAGDRYGVPLRQALARVYERQGKVPEAIQEWQKVLQLSQPGTDPATEARERLERLRAR